MPRSTSRSKKARLRARQQPQQPAARPVPSHQDGNSFDALGNPNEDEEETIDEEERQVDEEEGELGSDAAGLDQPRTGDAGDACGI